MSNWKKRIIYIKVLNNSSDRTSRIDGVQEKPFNEDMKIKSDDKYYAETEYGLVVDDDISRDEAEFIEGFYSDYEDFDSVDYAVIDLSNYEISKEQTYYYSEYFEDEEYDENCIYLDGEKSIYEEIKLKDVIKEIDRKNFSSKQIIVLSDADW